MQSQFKKVAFFQLKDESESKGRLDSMCDDEDSDDEEQDLSKLNKSIQQAKGGLKKNVKSFNFSGNQLSYFNSNQ